MFKQILLLSIFGTCLVNASANPPVTVINKPEAPSSWTFNYKEDAKDDFTFSFEDGTDSKDI